MLVTAMSMTAEKAKERTKHVKKVLSDSAFV